MNHRVFERTLRLLVFREARLFERQRNPSGPRFLANRCGTGMLVRGCRPLRFGAGRAFLRLKTSGKASGSVVRIAMTRTYTVVASGHRSSLFKPAGPHGPLMFDLKSDEDTR